MRACICLLCLSVAAAGAFPDYTGYSGAPGSAGTCAGSCHGTPGGTILVTGFPTAYEPGRTYLVTVSRSGGSSIANFNASARIGTGAQTAGSITAGSFTEVYSVPGEPNGVHFAQSNQDQGTFNWTAPDPAVGQVRLHVSGHQAGTEGPNTELVLSSEPAGIEETTRDRTPGPALLVRPTIACGRVLFLVSSPAAPARIRIVSRDGLVVARLRLAPGPDQAVVWAATDAAGRVLPRGLYQVILETGTERRIGRFVLR